MRIIPMLTAIMVTAFLYLAVFERDALLAFARGDAAAAQTMEQGDTAEETDAVAETDDAGLIGVVVLKSKAQEIDSAVILRGLTKADRQVEVRAETSSTVVSDPIRKGTHVEKGQVLCQLDPGTREATVAETLSRLTEAESRVPEAEARVKEALSRLEEARVNWNAAEKLVAEGYASTTRLKSTVAALSAAEAAVASSEAGLDTAQSGIQSARAAVAAAEREIARLTIVAPFSGLLESDTAEIGSLLQPGGLCATVIRLDPIKLVGYVPETQINRVEIGALAGARLATGQEVAGQVIFTSRAADPQTRTFEVEIAVPNPDLNIRDGQTAEIAISTASAKAHKLPQSALTLNNEGQLGVRVVNKNNIVDFLPIRIQRDTVDGVLVSGLPDEADVIVVGQEFVTRGVQVRPTYREAAK